MRFLLLFCLLLLFNAASAQQYNFRNWTLEQGLPQSQVNDVLQDHDGQLWVATRGGISRFNGKDFITYTKEEGLSSNNVSCLFQDSRNNIWIGSTDHGLTRYTGRSFFRYDQKEALPIKTIFAVAEDKMGRIWLATEKGLFYGNLEGFVKYNALPEQAYTSLLLLPNGTIWTGSATNGLYKITNSGSATNYKTENSALPSNSISSLIQTNDKTVWIGTDAGVAQIKQDSLAYFPLPITGSNLAVTSFVIDAYNNLWIALRQNGIVKYDGKSYTHITRLNGLRSRRVNTLATDNEGNVWIGMNGYGLQQYMSPWFVHYFESGDISEPRVTALSEDSKGTIWLGTDEGTTAYMSGGHLNWNRKTAWPEGTAINHILMLDGDKNVWVSTSNGVWHITPDSTIQYTMKDGLPANEAFHCTSDTKGNIWIATANGATCFNKGKFTNYTPDNAQPSEKIYQVFQDSKNRIWFGSISGIYQLKNNKLTKVPELDQFHFEDVVSIVEDKAGVLYFGGFNYGIIVLNEAWQKPKLFNASDGLPNEGIKGLFVDASDNLWVGTSRDVLKVRLPILRQNGRLNYRSYAGSNGFKGIEICYNAITQTPDGSVWFGTTKGLTKYLPSLDRRNKVYPELALTDIMLYQKPTNWEKLGFAVDTLSGLPVNLKLPHTQNHLTFDFHAICLSGPDKVKYKHRLKGYEKQWSPATDQSFATYANLNPGTYTFELHAQNNDGYWTPQPLLYTFSIVPPIWRREWFIGVLLLILAGSVLSIVRLRERSLVKMNTLLEMRVNHRTRLLERKNREKEMLLQEIHHRVKNNLQIVISMLNLQARHVNDPQAVDVMRAIRSRVRSMAILHERLYRLEDLDQIDLDDYFMSICQSLYEAYGFTQEDVLLELQVPAIRVDIDTAITLGLIVNELVSNSLKYAFPDCKGKGLLSIVLEQLAAHHCILTVSDNGKGLPANFDYKRTQSFGLQLVSSLSRKLNGTISFINNNGTKSILHFVLPS
ncbi:two-component regulator propeller domain-containing protein [Pontibacter sp. MBLB2868]|uniref:two-component regulator propeller domain-containing protein n=1 Tax=Pontibacter sp. MBLB2868 TaxID=3451555 RepID=UPI003F753218